ncbi:MAG: chemotaxis protein CheW [Solirubrobacteraceae bacterium]|jgi:purine-binding chemotaxis protein CheW
MSDETHTPQLVVFTLAGEQYALPIQRVQEIIRYTAPRPVASRVDWVQGVISLRGRIVPVYDLASRLGVASEANERSTIVIVETETDTVGVIVDAVEEVLTISREQIEPVPCADSSLVDSIAKIDDRLVVLLEPTTVFAGVEETGGSELLADAA